MAMSRAMSHQASDSVRERILREGGCHHIEYQQMEDNEALRRAATQCICNLAMCKKIQERYHPGTVVQSIMYILMCIVMYNVFNEVFLIKELGNLKSKMLKSYLF